MKKDPINYIQQANLANQSRLSGASVGSQPNAGSFLLGLLPGGSLIDKGLRGEAITGGDVALEAGLSLVPFGLGKLAKGAKGIVGGSKAASGAFGSASKTSTAARLTGMGDRALMSQYGTIGKSFARSTNPQETISTLAGAGIMKPLDAERISSIITGGNGLVTKAVANATGRAGGVNTNNLKQVFEDGIQNYGLVEKDAASVRKVFEAQLGKLYGGARGSLSTKANPTETLGVIRSLEKRIANLSGKGDNYGMPTPERIDQASVLRLVKDELEDQLYAGAGANSQLKNILTPDFRKNIVDLMPNNPKWVNYVDTNIMGAKSVGDLRSSVAPFVNARKIIEEGERNAMTFGGRAGNALAGNGIRGAVTSAASEMLREPVGRAAGTALRGAGGLLENTASTARAGLPGPAKFLAGQAGVRLGADALGLRNQEPTLDEALMQQSGDQFGGQLMQTNPDGSFNPAQPGSTSDTFMSNDPSAMSPPQQNPYPRENLLYDIQRDPANADQYIARYQQLQEVFGPQGETDLSQSSRNALASSDNAINTIDQLEGLFTNTGGGSGRIGGFIQGLAGGAGFDENAKIYSDLANSSVTQIAKALAGSGSGTVSDMDAKVILSAIPKITDTPEEARVKFAALRQRLENSRNNTRLYGSGGGGSLEEALMSQQQGGF